MDWKKLVQKAGLLVSAGRPEQFPAHSRREIVFVGRSNVGKSSLINCLLGRQPLARVSREPGRTRTLNFYAVGDNLCFVDVPGYGYARVSHAEREHWRHLMQRYLEGREQLAGAIQVVDVRHPPSELDQRMACWLRQLKLPALVVATKADKIARGQWKGRADALARELSLPVVLFSAETGDGRDEIRRWIEAVLADPGIS